MDRQTISVLFQEGGKLLASILQTYGMKRPSVPLVEPKEAGMPKPEWKPDPVQQPKHITTDETVRYQKRELAKELILLEGHLQQGCKINDKACDCCEKHPIKIEGLAQETAGMSPDPVFPELAAWVSQISPMTTEEASASGKYDKEYPRLAMAVREFRKAIMTPDIVKEVVDDEEISSGGEEPHTEVPS